MLDIYAKALGKAFIHRRTALHLELAVGLCVFWDKKGEDPAQSRVELVRCYAETGYDCTAPGGSDYKTVNRRVNTAWLLWEHLGGARKIRLGKVQGQERIAAAKAVVQALGVRTAYDVLDLVGRSQRRERAADSPRRERSTGSRQQPDSSAKPNGNHARRATDGPGVVHVKTRHIDVPIPPAATKAELMNLVGKLVKLAETIGQNTRADPQKRALDPVTHRHAAQPAEP